MCPLPLSEQTELPHCSAVSEHGHRRAIPRGEAQLDVVSRAAAGSCVWVGFVGERWPCSSSGCQRLEGWALVTSWVRLTQTPELRVPCAPPTQSSSCCEPWHTWPRKDWEPGWGMVLPASRPSALQCGHTSPGPRPPFHSGETSPLGAPEPLHRLTQRAGPEDAGWGRAPCVWTGCCRLRTAVAPSGERHAVCTRGGAPSARPLTGTSSRRNGSPESA